MEIVYELSVRSTIGPLKTVEREFFDRILHRIRQFIDGHLSSYPVLNQVRRIFREMVLENSAEHDQEYIIILGRWEPLTHIEQFCTHYLQHTWPVLLNRYFQELQRTCIVLHLEVLNTPLADPDDIDGFQSVFGIHQGSLVRAMRGTDFEIYTDSNGPIAKESLSPRFVNDLNRRFDDRRCACPLCLGQLNS